MNFFFLKLKIWNIDIHTCLLDSTFLCPHLPSGNTCIYIKKNKFKYNFKGMLLLMIWAFYTPNFNHLKPGPFSCNNTYLGRLSKFSVNSTLFSTSNWNNLESITLSSKTFLLWRSIKFPVFLSMLNPKNVMVLRSGLKNKYGCGLKNNTFL